jgi:hypothetical protein
MSDPLVKCEACKRVEHVREEDDPKDPYAAARKRLRKRCTRNGHVSQPIITAAHETWVNRT